MTKRQTRLFFIIGTLTFAGIFLALTLDSHRQFGELTNAELITEDVSAGKDVWHAGNCVNCHTLLGEGAYYAPDLTKITQQRGIPYLTAFMKNPSQFYSEEQYRRLMPNPGLSPDEIRQVLAFLEWVSNINNNGWPPRPIRVTGGSFGQVDAPNSSVAGASDDPIAIGQTLFAQAPANCSVCHSTAAGITLAGPSLAGLSDRIESLLASSAYTGTAQDVEGYLRESILQPSAHVVPGPVFSANGRSFMPDNFADLLDQDQVGDLVQYLLTLR